MWDPVISKSAKWVNVVNIRVQAQKRQVGSSLDLPFYVVCIRD